MSTQSSARSSFVFLLAGRGSSAVLQSAILVLLAREIAPSTFGIVATYTALVTVVGAVADLGLETLALRSTAAGGDDVAQISYLHRRTVGLVCVLVLAASIGATTLLPSLTALLPLVAWVWLERRLNLHVGLRIARGQSLSAGAVLAGSRLLTLVGFIGLVRTFDAPVFAYACSCVVGTGIGVLVASTHAPAMRPSAPGELLGRARPFWRASVSGLLRTLDVPIVQAIAGSGAAGLYALPARAVGPLRLVATSMATTAIPYAARGDKKRLRELERLTIVSSVGMAAALAAAWAFVDNLVTLVLGSGYAGAADVLRVLSIGVIVNVPGAFWSGALQGMGHERFVAISGVWLVVVFVPSVAIGGLLAGALGAAIGVTATLVVQVTIFGWKRGRMSAW